MEKEKGKFFLFPTFIKREEVPLDRTKPTMGDGASGTGGFNRSLFYCEQQDGMGKSQRNAERGIGE